jgi:hypothetical protein
LTPHYRVVIESQLFSGIITSVLFHPHVIIRRPASIFRPSRPRLASN